MLFFYLTQNYETVYEKLRFMCFKFAVVVADTGKKISTLDFLYKQKKNVSKKVWLYYLQGTEQY